jgi:membrane-bound serine protease (ClpP class)
VNQISRTICEFKAFSHAIIILLTIGVTAAWPQEPETPAKAFVTVIQVDDAIGPGVAEFIANGIRKANEEKAVCIVIELDTPGGLADSMRRIVKAIFESEIPVVVFVAPSGARAASAGVMITLAADIAAMAPGTNIGAAHPVGAGGKEIGEVMSEKVVNDMVAYVKSIAKRRGKNEQWAEEAVRQSVSVTEGEALKKNIIDLIARDTDDLLSQLNGRQVKGKGTLDLDQIAKKFIEEDLRTKILKTISDPNIAYILLMIGLAGLYFELANPGAVFPGVIGAIALVLAFFSMQTLPVNYAGLLLIGLSIVFFIIEMKMTSYGLLSFAGVLCLLLGTLMMFEGEDPAQRLSWQVLIPTLGVVSGFFILVAGLVFRARLRQPKTGAMGLLGETGVVKKALAPEGKVFVHGELWQAMAKEPIAEGAKVRVLKVTGLVIEVEPEKTKE